MKFQEAKRGGSLQNGLTHLLKKLAAAFIYLVPPMYTPRYTGFWYRSGFWAEIDPSPFMISS